jgi:mannose-6-phosphate isomerase-like protein (cupin superfamily)
MELMARAETTGGHFTFMVNDVAPGAGPALHRHGGEDEMYFILDGTFRFRLGDDVVPAPPGAFVYIPKGTQHCFQNTSDTTGRFLVMFTPAGMERYFEAQAGLPAGTMDSAEHRRVAQANGMEVLGPPLAVTHPV